MDGYRIIGLTLLFSTFLLLGRIFWTSRRLKRNLHDQEITRAAVVIRLRNTAVIMAMFGLSVFWLLLSSLPLVAVGTAEHTTRNNLASISLVACFILLAAAVCLTIISKYPQFNFQRLVRRYAIREKMRAKLHFKRPPKRKSRI